MGTDRKESVTLALRDSRRLTGANLILDGPGAVIDAACPDGLAAALVEAWGVEIRKALRAVGWDRERPAQRIFPGGASLAISAPVDALYAATEVNEWAFEAARAKLAGEPAPDLPSAAARLLELIRQESRPALIALRDAAAARGIAFLTDDEKVSLGTGCGSMTWAIDAIPEPDGVPWDEIRDVPVALVTGTNGKSTTVRLLASIARHAGWTAGMTCTDSIEVGEEIVERGDWSGPSGARTLLRNRRVEVAILETAGGGMLRRGLGVACADAAIVTNVAEDHLGEWGVADLAALADTKLIVGRAIGPDGLLVLNADDPILLARGRALGCPVAWFSLEPQHELFRSIVSRPQQGGTELGGPGTTDEPIQSMVARSEESAAEEARMAGLGRETAGALAGAAVDDASDVTVAAGVAAGGAEGDRSRVTGAAGVLEGTPEDDHSQVAAAAGWVEEDRLVLLRGGRVEPLLPVEEIPIALGGAARHNVANALGAALVASALGFTTQEIASGLRGFTGGPDENPGRGNLFDLGGVKVLVDFAHNPHGFRALFEMAAALPAERRLILMGQAGDRDDASIRALVEETWKARPERIVIKEMEQYLRGREAGEVPALIERELRRLGAGDDVIEHAPSEVEGARQALRWARPGDLLLQLSHSDRSVLLKPITRLRDRGWQPGERLP